jgi:hypothetical protein
VCDHHCCLICLIKQSANHPHTAKHPRTKKANPVKSWLFLVLKFYFRGFVP